VPGDVVPLIPVLALWEDHLNYGIIGATSSTHVDLKSYLFYIYGTR